MAGGKNWEEYTETLSNWRLSDCNPFLVFGNTEIVDVRDRVARWITFKKCLFVGSLLKSVCLSFIYTLSILYIGYIIP